MLGIFITAAIIFSVFVILIIIIRLMILGNKKFEMLKKQTLERAIEATAEILSVKSASGSSQYGGVRRLGLRLNLEVNHPQLGKYKTSSVWMVNELLIPQVQPQKILPVLVNADDPNRVYPKHEEMEFADWLFRRI